MLTYDCANAILNLMVTKSNKWPYKELYVGLGLSSSSPRRDGTGYDEPSGNGYERVLLGVFDEPYTQKMGTPSMGTVTNAAETHFKAATGTWGTCKYFLLFDGAGSNANLLAFGELTDEISPITDTVPIIPVGDIVMALT